MNSIFELLRELWIAIGCFRFGPVLDWLHMSVPFASPSWLKSGHAQTLYGALVWKPPVLEPGQRLQVPVETNLEANKALLCWHHQTKPASENCLILVHGLESSADAPYIVAAAARALELGINVLRVNLRGCGGSQYLCPTPYHAGMSLDLLAVARYAAQQLGYTQIGMAGFSLGGHILLKLAGELGAEIPVWLKGIVTVSPPVMLGMTSKGLLHPSRRIYERHFFYSMLRTYRQRRRYWPESTPLDVLSKVKNLYDFDQWITAPAFGYQNAEEYYQKNSALQFLSQIRLPVKIIFALDDPIIPFQAHQQAMQLQNPAIQWLLSAEGGHVGFFNDSALARQDRDGLWAQNRLLDTLLKWFDTSNSEARQSTLQRV